MRKPTGGRAVTALKGWHKYIHVLDEAGLAWYTTEEAAKQHVSARGRVPLHNLLGAEATPSKGATRFVVRIRSQRGEGKRDMKLRAETPALMHRWIELTGRHLHAHNAATAGTLTGQGAAPAMVAKGRNSSGSRRRGSLLDLLSPRRANSNRSGTAGSVSTPGSSGTTPRRGSLVPFRKLGALIGKSSEAVAIGAAAAVPAPPPAEDGGRGAAQEAARKAAAEEAAKQLAALGKSGFLDDVTSPGGVGLSVEGGGGDAAVADAAAAAGEAAEEEGLENLTGEALEKRVLAIPGNSVCADCITSDVRVYAAQPTWASTNLGVTFCIRCSGVHRRLGAHISKVLSIQIDTWTAAQLAHMRMLGNAVVNDELEAALPPGAKPDSATATPRDLEAFIRAKYELRSFVAGGDGQLADVAETAAFSGEAAVASAKAMAEFCGLLIIRLIRATNLPAMDLLGHTDAYVELSLQDRKATSKTIRNSLNPNWNETLSLNVRALSESLILKVFDKTKLGADAFIGQCLIPLADLTHDGRPMGFDLTLERADNANLMRRTTNARRMTFRSGSGSVALELTYNPLDR